MNKKSFLGQGWSFPPRFDDEMSELTMVSEEKDIRESLFILMSTTPGERVTYPTYGCDLHQYAFKPIDSDTRFLMRETITKAIRKFEPRVELDDIQFDVTDQIEGVIYLTVFYKIIKSNIRTNIVYPFYLVEGTEVKEV